MKSIGARLRAAQLTQLAAVSLDDDPCVGYSLNAEPSNPDSKRFYHFLSLEGAWPLPVAFSYHPGRERVRRSTAWSLGVAAYGVRSATRTICVCPARTASESGIMPHTCNAVVC